MCTTKFFCLIMFTFKQTIAKVSKKSLKSSNDTESLTRFPADLKYLQNCLGLLLFKHSISCIFFLYEAFLHLLTIFLYIDLWRINSSLFSTDLISLNKCNDCKYRLRAFLHSVLNQSLFFKQVWSTK